MRRQVAEKFGTKGLALLALAVMHVAMAVRVYSRPVEFELVRGVLYEQLLTPEFRVGLWLLFAVLLASTSCRWRWRFLGFGLALIMPLERSVSYAWAVVFGEPHLDVNALGLAAFWGALAFLVNLVGRSPDGVPAAIPDEAPEPAR